MEKRLSYFVIHKVLKPQIPFETLTEPILSGKQRALQSSSTLLSRTSLCQ